MPVHSHSTTSNFHRSNARELCHYDELEYLFNSCSIIDDMEKKCYAVCYLDVDTKDSWKQLTQYNGQDSYNGFKKAVLKLYPDVDGDCQWMLSDLDKLTGMYS